jgi:dual-specificity kinase
MGTHRDSSHRRSRTGYEVSRARRKLARLWNEELSPEYQVIKKIGEGSFGKVLDCWDIRKQRRVAIKVQSKSHKHAVRRERSIMELIQRKDPDNTKFIVRYLDYFRTPDNSSMCLVFEKGHNNLYDSLRSNKCSMAQIQQWGKQLLTALQFIHELDLTHADLKPENR